MEKSTASTRSRWDDAEAQRTVDAAGDDPADRDLALRVYTSRLIGSDPDLVLHGGGNTSVKTERDWPGGGRRRVLHVKGSGWDLGTIEAPGLPALDLDALLEARRRGRMSDPEMVGFLRASLMDANAPNPSVETLLHAFLPGRYVDHSHAVAILVLANQPEPGSVARELYGDRLGHVSYVMPGYDLSIAGAEIQDGNTGGEGLWLDNHGLFTMGDTARESYERMIDAVALAERHLVETNCPVPAHLPPDAPTMAASSFAERLSRALTETFDVFGGVPALDFRTDANVADFLAMSNLDDVARRGTITPDHVIRVKPFPVILDATWGEMALRTALAEYASAYEAYFQRNAPQADEPKTMLDAAPRVALVRGLGLFGIGRDAKEARIVADLAVQAARVIPSAERYGRFTPIPEARLFEMEYWALEQAKLKQ